MDSHQNGSWTVVILLFSQININVEDVDPGTGNVSKAPDQKKQTQEFRDLIANLPIEDGNAVYIVYNQVNVLETGPQNDYTEIMKLSPASKQFEYIQSYDTAGIFQTPDKLAAVLQVLKPKIPPTDNVLLMTWDHGSVFGIFKKFKVPPGTKPADVDSVATFVDFLTPDELAQAIDQGLGRKVDLLVMMNCWMQNFHTLYGLRKVADNMVASEGLVTSFVYDYKIFSRLKNRTPASVAQEMTKGLVPSYKYLYTDQGYELNNRVDTCSIFTTTFNLQLDQFMTGVSKLTDKLFELLDKDPKAGSISGFIHDAWVSLFVWDRAENNGFNYFMVDFVTFITNFSNTISASPVFSGNAAIQNLAGDVKALTDLLPSFSPNPNIGKCPYYVLGGAVSVNYTGKPTGTGIFFPPDLQSFNNSFYSKNLQKANQIGYYSTANPGWLTFLQKYYAVHG